MILPGTGVYYTLSGCDFTNRRKRHKASGYGMRTFWGMNHTDGVQAMDAFLLVDQPKFIMNTCSVP